MTLGLSPGGVIDHENSLPCSQWSSRESIATKASSTRSWTSRSRTAPEGLARPRERSSVAICAYARDSASEGRAKPASVFP